MARNIPRTGEWLIGWYPTKNRDTPEGLTYAPRHLCILSVRDLRKEPLAIETLERRPLLRRGRYLAFAWDEDLGETRCFYLEAMKPRPDAGDDLPPFSIVSFDPDAPAAGLTWIGPEFGPDAESRATLATACRQLRQAGQAESFRVAPADDSDAA